MSLQTLQIVSWREFLSNPTDWWNNKQSKLTFLRFESKHKDSNVDQLNNWHGRVWLDAHLFTLDVEVSGPPESVCSSAQRQGASAAHGTQSEVELCSKLCEDGRIVDAVDVLSLIVERRHQLHNNLFYRVLKGCISRKDLVLGRRTHALITKSGHDGDAFLANHLIGMYASYGRLEEAIEVFTKVLRPDAYVWASIIFAYARHGDAKQAIRLYRQMRESIVKPDNRIYTAVLKACATAGDLVAGKEVHAHILAGPSKPDTFVQNGLVHMYAKCKSLEDAREVFDRLQDKDVVTWNAMIAGYAQQGMGHEALDLYSGMQKEGLSFPSPVTFVCLLQACGSIGSAALRQGKEVHAQIKRRGLQNEVVLGGSLVNMYVKCGSIEEARSIFDRLPDKNVVAWTTMIAGYAQQGMGQEALILYSYMQQEGLSPPDSVAFVCLLQACGSVGMRGLHQGKQLHAQIEAQGLQHDAVLGGSLVNMYSKCGDIEQARAVFDALQDRTVVTWTAMIAGYSQEGMGEEALKLYTRMQQEGICLPSSVTFVCLLQACASVGVGALHQGKKLHLQIEEQGLQVDVVLGCSLVNMYAKCGSPDDARRVFDKIPDRNIVILNAMLAGYVQQGMGKEALELYDGMNQDILSSSDSVTFMCLLQACAIVGVEAMRKGKQVHAQIDEQGLQGDSALCASLINMYTKCGGLEDARHVFDKLTDRNVATWTAMIAGYAQQGMGREALSLYNGMEQEGLSPPDSVTFICLLQACASIGVEALGQGKQLHDVIGKRDLHRDLVLNNSLVSMYSKCGSIEDARCLFDNLLEKNIVTWNAMLAGYAQQGMGEEAVRLYSDMQEEGMTSPDSVTFVSILQACGLVADLSLGKQLHAQIGERGMLTDGVVGAALVNMYAKCGSMGDSQQVFDSLPKRSTEAWGALIGGYSRLGKSDHVFTLLDRMRQEGMKPDGITYLSVLTVCSHVGLVDRGRQYFEAMREDHGISPTIEHYKCMMDLLGRAGHLDEALRMCNTMPFPADCAVWHTLLSACQKWNDVEIGRHAFECAVSLDGTDASSYVSMANIYAAAQMWDRAREIQARRVESGAWKKQGQSWWTDAGGVVHMFGAGDKEHVGS